MAAPQALTPEQIQQIIAAGRGNTVNIGGTLYGANYADIGDGESRQEGALAGITGSTGIDQAGQPYYSYDPTGVLTGQGTTKKSQSFFGGLGDMFKDPVFLAALGGAGYAGLLGGGGAAAAAGGAGDLWAAEMAAAAPASEVAAATAAANAASTGLTAAQIANLAKAGISIAGLTAGANAISNIGGTKTAATPVTYSGGGAGAGYTPDYFSQVQSNYNNLMPNVPRDVASPLQQWYSTEFNPGASVTGSLFGDMIGGTSKTPVAPPIVPVVPKTVVPTTTVNAPSYTSLTKTSTPIDVAKAYSDFIANAGGNTAANRKAATDYLTNLGLTQGQIESSYSAYLNTLPAAGNTYDVLNAKATPANVASAYSAFINNAGGNTAANRETATNYLKDIGVADTTINQAYTSYLDKLPAAGNTYQELNAKATPTNIANAYSSFVAGSGGDTAANQTTAINYLKDIGLSDEQINQAYNTYVAEVAQPTTAVTGGGGSSTTGTVASGTGGGMLSGGGGTSTTGTVAAAVEEPSYTALGANSSPASIASAYADFVASAGGDTAANQQIAIDYLTSLGISQDKIGQAYGLFKGA